LDGVNVQQSLRGRNKGKVDSVGGDPNSPRPHNGGLEVGIEFLGVVAPRFALDHVQVSKEGATKDGIPNGLVDKDFGSDSDGFSSGQFAVQHSVKVVTCTSMEKESEGTQTDRTHDIVWLVTGFDEFLCQDISHGESGEGGQTFGQEWLGIQQFIVASPNRCHCCCELLYSYENNLNCHRNSNLFSIFKRTKK